jgi:hypothetical protein
VATLLALLLATAVAPALAGLAALARRVAQARADRRGRESDPAPDLTRLGADLRRLRVELEATETATGITAKQQRCRAVRAAYLDTLTTACRHLDVAPPSGRPTPQREIYRVEADLRRRGLDVRPVA